MVPILLLMPWRVVVLDLKKTKKHILVKILKCSSDDSHHNIDFLYFCIYVVLETEVIVHVDTNIIFMNCGF